MSARRKVKGKAALPPTAFFTTVMDPCWVLVKVQVVVTPAVTTMAAGVPLVQVALVCVQPAGTVSLTL